MSKVYNSECNNNPLLPTIIPSSDRIIAIGDVHGDMKLVIDCLVISQVIVPVKTNVNTIEVKLDNKIYKYKWIGGKTIVVQIGDQNDSCRPQNGTCNHIKKDPPEDIPIFEFFTELHELAKKEGGGVYSLIGNHELMSVIGDFKYTSNSNIDEFKEYTDPFTKKSYNGNATENRKIAFSNGNQYANLLACTRQSVLIVGDFLFIHAGINRYFLDKFQNVNELEKLNDLVKKWLLNKLSEIDTDPHTLNQLLNDADNSPFWMRVLGQLPPKLSYDDLQCQELLKPVIEAYKIKGMIIGHTPQIDHGINATCGEKLFRVDVGASRAFQDRREPEVLEILKIKNKKDKDGKNMYQYKVIFQKEEVYQKIVPDDISSFKRLVQDLP
jgi:hypothetical protein